MEFRDKPMQNLVRIPEKDICKNAQKLLLDGETVVEDVKGYRDPSSAAYAKFVIKRKLMLERYGIRVKEV